MVSLKNRVKKFNYGIIIKILKYFMKKQIVVNNTVKNRKSHYLTNVETRDCSGENEKMR